MTERDRKLIESAAFDIVTVTIAYCSTLKQHFDSIVSGPPEEIAECLKEAQDAMRALNHASGAIERLHRVLRSEEVSEGGLTV